MHFGSQGIYIAAAYVALVRTRMHGNAVGSETLDIYRRLYHIGIIFASRIAKCGYFIDIDA